MIIEDEMTKKEKEIFTKILYNREMVLTRDFIEIEKIKREVAFS